MRVLAPAKINLHLRVGPIQASGFHPLLTWMVTAGLFDTLTFVRRRDRKEKGSDASGGAEFSLSCDHPLLAKDLAGNLVTRVATSLADASGRIGEGSTTHDASQGKSPGSSDRDRVSAFLIKRIPPGAGLAGGSSDAVATLLALNDLWRLNWTRSRLSALAAQFGSDLPFFLHGPSSICTGRGEVVRPTPPPDICRWAVLVLPGLEMPTPAVYRRFDEMNLGSDGGFEDGSIGTEPDWIAWSKLPAKELMPRLVNDLEPPAISLRPQLGELRASLESKLSRIFRMSGSGSSLFSLCDSFEDATEQSQRVQSELNIDAIPVEIAPTQI